jgi:hypothetical protein
VELVTAVAIDGMELQSIARRGHLHSLILDPEITALQISYFSVWFQNRLLARWKTKEMEKYLVVLKHMRVFRGTTYCPSKEGSMLNG